MSNTAAEVAQDIVEAATCVSQLFSSKQFSDVDKHKTDDKAWFAVTAKSGEQFVITVEKVR